MGHVSHGSRGSLVTGVMGHGGHVSRGSWVTWVMGHLGNWVSCSVGHITNESSYGQNEDIFDFVLSSVDLTV